MRQSRPLLELSAAIALAASLGLTACATAPEPTRSEAAIAGGDLIIVAIADVTGARPSPGAAARADYRQAVPYSGGDRATSDAAALAAELGLTEIKAWSIAPLKWRCMLYRLPPGSARDAVLARLAADARVQLAQPLNDFETLAQDAPAGAYDDPYLALQTGFAAIDAGGAQRLSRGEKVTVAVIDTGVDAQHPDLQAQAVAMRDFVGGAPGALAGERHGTEVAGIIGAAANNAIGIAGVAPGARLLSLRACWAAAPSALPAPSAPARCNSFTLAQALAAAISAGADVINLSLGGPRDPLLERLAQQAMARGAVIVGATPAGGQRKGFPSALPGVVAVASQEDGAAPTASAAASASASGAAAVLAAPGARILTLAPGGGYDFASGSSMAAAHVSGVVALLRSLDRGLDGQAVHSLLVRDGGGIDACRAVQRLRPAAGVACAGPRPPAMSTAGPRDR